MAKILLSMQDLQARASAEIQKRPGYSNVNQLSVRLMHLAGTAAVSSDIPNPTFRERALPPFSNRRSNVSHFLHLDLSFLAEASECTWG
jgi:hypothetical protein